MINKALLAAALILINSTLSCTEKDSISPRVISTYPQNESQNIDPSLKEISVTFDEEMMDGNSSWDYADTNNFPQIVGQAYYTDNNTKNILPVILEPDKEYVIRINSERFKNFKDKSGNPAVPFKLTFKTIKK